MSPKKARDSTKTRRKPTLSPGIPKDTPAARTPRARRRKPSRADKWASDALYDLLHEICVLESLLSITARSLEQQEVSGDERAALELAIKMLRQADVKLNAIADKVDQSEPVSTADLIRAGAFDEEDDAEGSRHE
jgi:hypothetical protein